MSNVDFGTNSAAVQKKRVYYEGTNTIYEGMALCYNYDTTSNILGWDKGNGVKGSTTADGNQNEGKFLRVEEPSVANSPFFAGVVAGPDKGGAVGPCWLNIYIPNGAIVPVWTDKSITAKDKMYLEPGENTLVNDVQGIYVGMSLETKDRSSTAGIVLAKLDGVDTAGAVQVVDANSRTTVQLPTAAIWNNFDLEELRRNPFAGALLDVDFKRHSDMPDKTFSDAAGTILQPENAIGELALFETTDNQGNEVAWSIPVTVSGGAKWAIEFRIKTSVTGDNLGGWCCGLGLNSGAFAGDQIADGATLIDGGFVGFQSKEADGDKIDLVYDEASQTQNEHDDDYITNVAATYDTMGLYFNGTTIQGYANGVLTGTAISAVDIAAADFPTAAVLSPVLYMKNGNAADYTVTLDWIRVAQQSA